MTKEVDNISGYVGLGDKQHKAQYKEPKGNLKIGLGDRCPVLPHPSHDVAQGEERKVYFIV